MSPPNLLSGKYGILETQKKLQTQYPPPWGADTRLPSSAALDSLAVVIRHIFSLMDPEWWSSFKAENPLMEYIMGDYVALNHEEQRRRTVDWLCKRLKTDPERLSFEVLGEANVTQRMLWSKRGFLLFSLHRQRSGERGWTRLDDPRADLGIAKDSLVNFDGTRSLEETILSRFGLGEDNGDGFRRFRVWEAPFIIRVRYTIRPGQKLGFHALRTLSVDPTRGESNDRSQARQYRLIAAVRLNEGTPTSAMARTFAMNGMSISTPQTGCFPGFHWRVGDPEFSPVNMLYYVKDDAPHLHMDPMFTDKTRVSRQLQAIDSAFDALFPSLQQTPVPVAPEPGGTEVDAGLKRKRVEEHTVTPGEETSRQPQRNGPKPAQLRADKDTAQEVIFSHSASSNGGKKKKKEKAGRTTSEIQLRSALYDPTPTSQQSQQIKTHQHIVAMSSFSLAECRKNSRVRHERMFRYAIKVGYIKAEDEQEITKHASNQVCEEIWTAYVSQGKPCNQVNVEHFHVRVDTIIWHRLFDNQPDCPRETVQKWLTKDSERFGADTGESPFASEVRDFAEARAAEEARLARLGSDLVSQELLGLEEACKQASGCMLENLQSLRQRHVEFRARQAEPDSQHDQEVKGLIEGILREHLCTLRATAESRNLTWQPALQVNASDLAHFSQVCESTAT